MNASGEAVAKKKKNCVNSMKTYSYFLLNVIEVSEMEIFKILGFHVSDDFNIRILNQNFI